MKKRFLILTLSSFAVATTTVAQIAATSQGFRNVEMLAGWGFVNESSPLGETNWFQGDGNIFISQSGFGNAYIAANHRNTGGEAGNPGIICNYIIMPDVGELSNVSFYTRSTVANNNFSIFPDRMYMVFSPTGGIETGNCTDDFGDFTETLLVINPDLTQDANSPDSYPIGNWLQFSSEINGPGRVAFVYYVDDAGFFGSNSNFVGVDTVEWVLAETENETVEKAMIDSKKSLLLR